jgi:serine/threonine protein kinase
VLHPGAPGGVPAVGEVFAGKYRIEGVLGVGGMGAVLSAIHIHLDERVAIKVMLPDLAKDAATGVRFLREARALVKIKSEHVAKLLDFGQLDNGQSYMVMEHLEGEDLETRLRRLGPLPVVDTVDYLLQACEAIAQAHGRGIVHRDIKPGNLFLTTADDGTTTIKVLDFGVLKATDLEGSLETLTLTATQACVGSPLYMAPEQMRPNQPVDARTDIWSLGVVVYELLTGKLPWNARTMAELCVMVLRDPPPPLRREGVSRELEAAILRCLKKKPGDRYNDIGALAAAFAPFGSPQAKELVTRISRARRANWDEPSGSRPSAIPVFSSIAEADAFRRGGSPEAKTLARRPPRPSDADARTRVASMGRPLHPAPLPLRAAIGAGILLTAVLALYFARGSGAPSGSSAVVPASSAEPEPPPPVSAQAADTPWIVVPGSATDARDANPQPIHDPATHRPAGQAKAVTFPAVEVRPPPPAMPPHFSQAPPPPPQPPPVVSSQTPPTPVSTGRASSRKD